MPYVNNEGTKVFITDDKFVQLLMRDYQVLSSELLKFGILTSIGGDGFVKYMSTVEPVPTAADIRAQEILIRLPEGRVKGAEIGVFRADLSKRLLSREYLTLIMVDSWMAQPVGAYADTDDFHATLTQEQQDSFYIESAQIVEFAHERADIIRLPSVKAAEMIKDGDLDFVFIDADHSYEGCMADIKAWWPKVRKGGLFSGHDYENTHFTKFGVKKAVDEFSRKHKLDVELGDNFTWFIRK